MDKLQAVHNHPSLPLLLMSFFGQIHASKGLISTFSSPKIPTNATAKPTTHAPSGIEDVILVFIAGSVPSLVILCLICFLIYTKLTSWRELRKIRGNQANSRNNIGKRNRGPSTNANSTTEQFTTFHNTSAIRPQIIIEDSSDYIPLNARPLSACDVSSPDHSTGFLASGEIHDKRNELSREEFELEILASQEKSRNKMRMRHRLGADVDLDSQPDATSDPHREPELGRQKISSERVDEDNSRTGDHSMNSSQVTIVTTTEEEPNDFPCPSTLPDDQSAVDSNDSGRNQSNSDNLHDRDNDDRDNLEEQLKVQKLSQHAPLQDGHSVLAKRKRQARKERWKKTEHPPANKNSTQS